MKNSTVINNAPWAIAVGCGSFFAKGQAAQSLTLSALVVLAAVIGALWTHFPNRVSTTAIETGDLPTPALTAVGSEKARSAEGAKADAGQAVDIPGAAR